MTDAEKHATRAAEARRRIDLAAALEGAAQARPSGESAAILAGARAYLWTVAGIPRDASQRFLDSLMRHHGHGVVHNACVALCASQPPGPKAWLRDACAVAARQKVTS
ncbi:MAG: hypothetical protein EOO27_03125 [Comamonadaceae bacterium]|nr:MAG: hypothetical protein EOO27_03125 [Comamonadaceae bacterium]